MSSALLPEFFAILGIDIFLAMSILTCLLDQHFPRGIPYVYQFVALAGFGHLLISRGFMAVFGEYTRFWYSFVYLLVALANTIAINVHLVVSKKLWSLGKAFFGAVTVPVSAIVAFFVSDYGAQATYPLISLPPIPLELAFVAIITFDVAVIVIGLSAFFNLNWNRVTIVCSAIVVGTGVCTFLKPPGWHFVITWSAIILGIACALVLGASLYAFIRMKRETPVKIEGGDKGNELK